jgi:hypothetical protein
MAFLDNSGDIILDAVLTDTGRFRLAKGDGSFKIAKYAFGDDEIDYSTYNKSHTSGSAYYDLEILQTPVLEAFTNNTSTMKSKLISIPRTNLLYLPVLKLYGASGTDLDSAAERHATLSTFLVCADQETYGDAGVLGNNTNGILNGEAPGAQGAVSYIRIDQGLDTAAISPKFQIDADLEERQYIIEMDNRLGSIVDIAGNGAPISFIDDDNIASYFLSLGTSETVFNNLETGDGTSTNEGGKDQVIRGPRGTFIRFKVRASVELNTSTYLFTQLGGTDTTTFVGTNVYYIDTIIKITGATTGYSIDVPIRYIKKY